MVDPDALRAVPEERREAALLGRPVATLRDLEVLYGSLYTLGRGLTSEYGPYLSPDEARELVGSESLLVVRVDLRGGSPELADPPVERRLYAESDIELVAHSKFGAARGVDHSITHQSGQNNDAGKQADHAAERFTRWTTEDAVLETAESHPDGWLLDSLRALGEDEGIVDRIENAVDEALVPEATQLLVTVELAVEEGAVTGTDSFHSDSDWHYPGEIEVLQEAMAARKTAKFKSKNRASNAVGEGMCYVSGEEGPVFGVVDDPMKHYLSKQMERFPRFDADQSWRTQGLGREAAIAAQNGASFLEACQVSAPGVSAFYLPYFEGEMNARDADELYYVLASLMEEDDLRPIQQMYRRHRETDGDVGRLRFHFLVVHKYQKDRWRLLASEPSASVLSVVRLARSHQRALNSRGFATDSSSGALPTIEEYTLLNSTRSSDRTVGVVTSVGYFARTCVGEGNEDPSSDDFRFSATADVVGGRSLDVRRLLSEYVERIVADFDPDSEFPFPSAVVASQYAQLSALADAGLLDGADELLIQPPEYMTEAEIDTDAAEGRAAKFEQFVDDHPALDDDERRGVFALGALVGRLHRYQRREGRSTTAVTTYPVDNLTRNNLKRVATEVVGQNVVYSDEEGYRGTMFAELSDGIVHGLTARDPDEWTLAADDLRFYYALGIAYGLNDSSTSEHTDD